MRGPGTTRTFTDRVAAFFKAHPSEWIDGRELAQIGGAYAWRTRVSDCRLELGMEIGHRIRKVGRAKVSEYQYLPPVVAEPPRDAADLNAWSLR